MCSCLEGLIEMRTTRRNGRPAGKYCRIVVLTDLRSNFADFVLQDRQVDIQDYDAAASSEEPMPLSLCKALKLPAESTFRQGAKAWRVRHTPVGIGDEGTPRKRRRVTRSHGDAVQFLERLYRLEDTRS